MSLKAMNHVVERSPYTGSTYIVHLMVADVVNDQHNYEFYGSQDRLAQKCRLTVKTVRRALDQLVEDGWLLEHKRGRYETVLFKFVFKFDPVVYDPNESNIGSARWTLEDDEGKSTTDEGKSTDNEGRECRTNRKEPNTELKQTPVAPDGFDEFWQLYPRKIGKAEAQKSWLKVVKAGADPEVIQAGLEWWVQGEWRGVEQRFIPHGATWLNQQRWVDAPAFVSPEARGAAQDASEKRQEADRAVFEVAEALGEGRAWRGASEASYGVFRETYPEHLRLHLDKGFYDG